ncbi:MAG TPA: MarR family transcriptional regulator [Methanomassiliicoccales archaeon]|nr:MarR family transcriptional regulator [Methanomassiliicoccales archaeon]
MVAILGTLGFRAKSLLPTLESTPGVDKVVVFCNDHPRALEALTEVQEVCTIMDIRIDRVAIPDAFDLLQAAKAMRSQVRQLKNDGQEIAVFNIAGGTKMMSAAALLVCAMEGLNSVYVHDETYREIPLPLLKVDYSQLLTTAQKEILMFLWRNRAQPMTQVEIAQGMGKHKATINHHIQVLEGKNILHLVEDPRDRRKKVVRVYDALELMLEMD